MTDADPDEHLVKLLEECLAIARGEIDPPEDPDDDEGASDDDE